MKRLEQKKPPEFSTSINCGENYFRISWYCACMPAQLLSSVWLFATPWTAAHQAPPSMAFPRQEYWSGLPFPPAGDLPNPGVEPTSLMSLALAGRFLTTVPTRKPSNADWRTLCKILDQDSSKLETISKSSERQKQAQVGEHKETPQMDAGWLLVGSWNRECINGKAGKIQVRSGHFCFCSGCTTWDAASRFLD